MVTAMIKVVSRKPVPIYSTQCLECDSVMEYRASDVVCDQIICPVCGVRVQAITYFPVRYEETEENPLKKIIESEYRKIRRVKTEDAE